MLRRSELVRKEGMTHYGFGIDAMKSIKVCGHCGEMANVSQLYCKECGSPLSEENLYQLYLKRHRHCEKCKTVVTQSMKYCPECGRRLEETE